LQEGIEQHWSQDRVLADLEAKLPCFPISAKFFPRIAQRLHSDESVQALFEALDGRRNFWRALQLARTPRSLAAAWVLDACGAIEYRESAVADARGAAPSTVIELIEERVAASAALGAARTSPRTPQPALSADVANAETESLAREIEERSAALESLDHYALLGVAENASAAEIKKVYLVAARRYHPDALARAGLSAELRSRAGRLFAAIGTAHAVLLHTEKRAEYDAQRSAGNLDANALANAEILYRKGELLMRTGNFQGALEYLQACVELWPDEAAYQSALGWAFYKKLPSDSEAARPHLERALELAPNEGLHLFRLGVLLRSLGEAARSQQLLDRARTLDPGVS
jgi:curved DNA-binding protein CbpA